MPDIWDLAYRLIADQESRAAQGSGLSPTVVKSSPAQTPTAEKITESTKTGKDVFITKDNYMVPANGVIFSIEGSATTTIDVRQFLFSTVKEWNNLVITVNGEVFRKGNYAAYFEMGFAWYDPVGALYHLDLLNLSATKSVTVKVDAGIILKTMLQDYIVKG